MTALPPTLAADERVRAVRAALGPEPHWIVGGSVRDALLGRPVTDLDVLVPGDPEPAARRAARALGGPLFALSERFGAWRALTPGGELSCDVTRLQGGTIDADLARRDFSVNAIAIDGADDLIDPLGGRADLEARRLRVLGGDAPEDSAYAADPLRPLRLARLATELGFAPDDRTERLTKAAAPAVATAAGERVFAELRRIVIADAVLDGLALADRLGLTAAILPELAALHGVGQSRYHHLDVYGHTLEVLDRQVAIERDPGAVFGSLAGRLDAELNEPLADGLSRWQALRLAALLHDIGKPATRRVVDGRVSFVGHDSVGERMATEIFRRLRASVRLSEYVGRITRHHLTLGFLVHERPLARSQVYRYLAGTAPVEIETTVLTCADRLATRGRRAEEAIARHLELARDLLAAGLDWRAQGPPKPAVAGDVLAHTLGIEPGPELGRLLERLAEARYTGEAETSEQAVELARRLAGEGRL